MSFATNKITALLGISLGLILSVPAAAQLSATPGQVDIAWTRGTPAPTGVLVTINGATTITGAALTGSGASLFTTGTISGNTISVGMNPATAGSAALGDHNAILKIDTNAGSIDVPLKLTIGGTGTGITFSANPLILNSPFGGGTVSGTVTANTPGSQPITAITATAENNLSWLTASVNGNQVTVFANPFGLANGVTYNGTVTVNAGGSTGSFAVRFTVGASATGLTLSQNPINLTYTVGGTPTSSTVTVSSVNLSAIIISATANKGWITLDATSKSTINGSATFVVGVNTAFITAGTADTGQITFTGSDGSTATLIVNLNTTGGSGLLSISASQLNFTFPGGSTSQQVQASTSVTGTTTVVASSNVSWASASPQLATIAPGAPALFNVNVAPAGFAPGTYSGTITFQASGAVSDVRTVNVFLTVGTGGVGSGGLVNPTSLTFTHQTGTSEPGEQGIYIQGFTGSQFTASVTAGTGGNFVLLSHTSGNLPSTLLVRVNPTGLAVGNYQATININTQNGFFSVPVNLTVTSTPVVRSSPSYIIVDTQGSTAPQNRFLTITSSGAEQNFSVSATANWIRVSTTSTTTPGGVQVTLDPTGLAAGTYSGNVVITAPGAGNSTFNIPVVLVTGVGSGGTSFATPSILNFTGMQGSTIGSPTSQSVFINPGTSTSFTAQPNASWINVSPSSGFTPSNISVSINPQLLAAGNQSGTITINAGGLIGTVTVNASITGAGGALTVDPTSLTFDYQQGEAAPAVRNVNISSVPTGVQFAASVTSSTPWLSMTLSSNTAPATMTVGVNPAGLNTGTHTGTITVTPTGGSAQQINVTLNVRAAANLTVNQNILDFTYRTDGPAPASQPVQVGSTGSALGFSASTNASWIRVSPASGTTTATVQIGVEPAGLNPGNHTGTVTFTSTGGAATSTQTVTVNLRISSPLPTVDRAGNAASYLNSVLAPGTIIVAQGTFLGPETLTTGTLVGNAFPTNVGDTRVLFNGVPGPVLYTRADQVAAIVPYSLAGQTRVGVQVEYRGQRSNVVEIPLGPVAPGIFTLNASGTGPGSILNQDGSVNSAGNAAARGEIIVVYATGGGQTVPASRDGAVAAGADRTVLPFEATIGGLPAEVTYSGAAPGLVNGVVQLNIRTPTGLAAGTHEIVIRSAGVSSQGGVTVALR
jgi:uncharacterized protein (TIGR03437 family)